MRRTVDLGVEVLERVAVREEVSIRGGGGVLFIQSRRQADACVCVCALYSE